MWGACECGDEPSGSIKGREFYVLLTVYLGIIFVNNYLDAQFFSMYVYFYSLDVSGSHVPVIRRINGINATGVCHSVYMTVWCAGLQVQTCTPNGHLYGVTYARCRIDTINSPDDRHMAARNM